MKKLPTKSERQKCYDSRDKYFVCLDQHELWLDNLNPKTHEEIVKIQPTNIFGKKSIDNTCKNLKELYKSDCLPSWFMHFQVLRVEEKQKLYLVNKMKEDEANISTDDFWKNAQSK
jgi:cytochrome c oxidase assembly factor 6